MSAYRDAMHAGRGRPTRDRVTSPVSASVVGDAVGNGGRRARPVVPAAVDRFHRRRRERSRFSRSVPAGGYFTAVLVDPEDAGRRIDKGDLRRPTVVRL